MRDLFWSAIFPGTTITPSYLFFFFVACSPWNPPVDLVGSLRSWEACKQLPEANLAGRLSDGKKRGGEWMWGSKIHQKMAYKSNKNTLKTGILPCCSPQHTYNSTNVQWVFLVVLPQVELRLDTEMNTLSKRSLLPPIANIYIIHPCNQVVEFVTWKNWIRKLPESV